jgi:hypothetical protein
VMEKPVAEFDLTFPSEAEMRRSVEELLETLFQEGGIEQLREIAEDYPKIPSAPGLYALTAPDGVMVKVVTQDTAHAELKMMIRADIAKRMLRSFFVQGVADQKPYEQLSTESFPMFLKLKKQYRVELLSAPAR